MKGQHAHSGTLDEGYDRALGEGRLPKYETQRTIAERKRIGKRHAKRKVARATRKAHRR